MTKLTFEKDGARKFVNSDSKLIPIIEKEGWKEVKKEPVKKTKKKTEAKNVE